MTEYTLSPWSLADLFPTFCSLAGTDAPPDLDGVDLSAVLSTGAEPPDRPVHHRKRPARSGSAAW